MVWERLEELKREQAQEEAQRQAKALADQRRREQEEQARLAKERQRQWEEDERKNRVIREIFESTGVVEGLREIEAGLEGHVRRHTLILRKGKATLVWGNRYTVEDDGSIGYEIAPLMKALLARVEGVVDCSYITATADVATESLDINGNRVAKGDRVGTVDKLARALQNPNRMVGERHRPSKYSSSDSSSGNTECCNQ